MCAAFVVGVITGFFVSSRLWSRNVEFETTTSALHEVTTALHPLKLLKAGQTREATQVLEVQLGSALRSLELLSETLNRPGLLTNAAVLGAKALR